MSRDDGLDAISLPVSDVVGARPDIASGGSAGHPRWGRVSAVLVGVVLGATAMHQIDARQGPRAAAGAIDVRVALGAHAGDHLGELDGDPVVSIPLVISNFSGQPLTLTAIRVVGPGASLVLDPEERPRQPLPTTLVPGRPQDTRITVRSDCAVSLRPSPEVTLVVVDSKGDVHDLTTSIPDLDSVWGQTLAPLACLNAAP